MRIFKLICSAMIRIWCSTASGRYLMIFVILFGMPTLFFIISLVRLPTMKTTSSMNFVSHARTNDNVLMEWSPHHPPILDFFIRTWYGDGHWLVYLLRSIETYVPSTLYRDIIITFASEEEQYFRSYLPFFSLPIKLIPVNDIFIKDGHNKGKYYSQMYAKFHAYEHSDADYFIHMDSDTIFVEPVTRLDFLNEQDRVYVKRIKANTLPENAQVWTKVTEKLLLEPVDYETSTGFPFVFPRDLYQNAKHLIEKRHHKSLLEVAKTIQDFCEFTALGHYLITYMPKTRWIENDNKSSKIVQSWSWGGFGPNQVAWYECMLRAKHHKMCHLHKVQ